jgi:GTP-binding protein
MQQFNYQSAQFITSAAQMSQCPIDEGAEVAFCGRSNAGKSSAINTLTRQKKLARTSKTPGRITYTARLVDLPGYGYAKVPLTLKQYWQTHLDTYFRSRQSLKGVILLTDIRHALKPFDEMMLEWSHTAGLPIHVLLTKADKLARGAQQNALLKVNANLPKHAKAQTFSAPNGQGLETLKSVLDSWLSIDP